jgi:hypothetical protein
MIPHTSPQAPKTQVILARIGVYGLVRGWLISLSNHVTKSDDDPGCIDEGWSGVPSWHSVPLL